MKGRLETAPWAAAPSSRGLRGVRQGGQIPADSGRAPRSAAALLQTTTWALALISWGSCQNLEGGAWRRGLCWSCVVLARCRRGTRTMHDALLAFDVELTNGRYDKGCKPLSLSFFRDLFASVLNGPRVLQGHFIIIDVPSVIPKDFITYFAEYLLCIW